MGAQRPASSEVFKEIASAIGGRAARKLVEKMGGQRIKVPRQIGPDHEIAKAIGEKAATDLACYFHGTHLQLPALSAALRRQLVRELGHLTRREIVKRTGYCERQVYRLLAAKPDRAQGDLFGDAGDNADNDQ